MRAPYVPAGRARVRHRAFTHFLASGRGSRAQHSREPTASTSHNPTTSGPAVAAIARPQSFTSSVVRADVGAAVGRDRGTRTVDHAYPALSPFAEGAIRRDFVELAACLPGGERDHGEYEGTRLADGAYGSARSSRQWAPRARPRRSPRAHGGARALLPRQSAALDADCDACWRRFWTVYPRRRGAAAGAAAAAALIAERSVTARFRRVYLLSSPCRRASWNITPG